LQARSISLSCLGYNYYPATAWGANIAGPGRNGDGDKEGDGEAISLPLSLSLRLRHRSSYRVLFALIWLSSQ
jgi:hypothetical protein